MRGGLTLPAVLAAASVLSHAAETPSPASTHAEPQLLARLDRVAALYRDAALKFSCEEKIIFAASGRPSQFFNFEYIYAFSDTAGLHDYRVDARATRLSGKPLPVAHLSDYKLPYFLNRGYSWVFLFDLAHQPRHRYTVGPPGEAMGRPALPISFEPLGEVELDVNDWFGTLWADLETLQPLRVEAMKLPEREKQQAFETALASTGPIRGAAKEGWAIARVATEFTHVKNAMRFPGKITVTATLNKVRIRKGKRVPDVRMLFTVTQLYSGHRFFGVRAEEIIRQAGGAE